MTRKMNFIPHIDDYEWIRNQMKEDLKYRLETRHERTSLGRPLYYRINVQIIMTQECPYHCPFCIERKNPMKGQFDIEKQKEALRKVLCEHPAARLTITGGEPGLYPEYVKELADIYKEYSDNIFLSINTSGYSKELNGLGHINLSVNDYVKPNPEDFPDCTVQTIVHDEDMNLKNIKEYMNKIKAQSFSFRFLSSLERHDYNINILNELQENDEIDLHTFRVGDFFIYATFNYNGKHARITLGDMYQQTHNDYEDGYSNIIIHPDGHIGVNWN